MLDEIRASQRVDMSNRFFIKSVMVGLEFVSAMSAEVEFQLHPDGVLDTEMLAMIVIVLEPDFRKFTRVEGQIWRKTSALTAEHIQRIEQAVVASDILSAHPGHPAWFEAPQRLRVKTPILQRFCWQQRAGTRFEAAVEGLGLPGDKWETRMGR